ncbi:hypothetical protein MMC26_005258 [Xylographa opegraphella]|nr:hypothetical protein [Xylographa opegraphella]
MPPSESSQSTVAGNTRSKNPLAAGTLPATWTIYKFADAKSAYTTRRPPFVQQKGELNIENARRIAALADKQGLLPSNIRIAEFRAHEWDKSDFFWTFDLEGTRWIVKAYGGGPQGGVTYRKWLGVEEGFSIKPVAFSMKQAESERKTLPPRGIVPEPHKEAVFDKIRVATSTDTPSEDYNDLNVDEVMTAILSDEPGEIGSAGKNVTEDAMPVQEIIDLTVKPTSIPKRQLGFSKKSGSECRFELQRSKKGKKRQADGSECNNISAENSGNGSKRLRVSEKHKILEQAQGTDDDTDILCLDLSQPRLNSKTTQDVVESMERVSLGPEVLYGDTAGEDHDILVKMPVNNCVQHTNAAPIPVTWWNYSPLKKERDASHLYSATPPPQHPANMGATVAPVSPRPKWLSGRPMGRCRMVAERILADRHRIVRAVGSGCRQCTKNSYECITAPGRKHCAFCTSRGSARNYFCCLATNRPKTSAALDGVEVSIVEDEGSPSSFVDNQYYGSRHFAPPATENENSYHTSYQSVDSAALRSSISQVANVAASVERGLNNIGDNAGRQKAESSGQPQQDLNTPQPAASHQDESPNPVTEHTLSAYKQANTTLQVSLGTDSPFVPIRFRFCMTISSFFDMVLAACDLEDQEHTMTGVEVQYEWLPNMRMMIKQKIPDSFAEMLEIVDHAPCWKQAGGGRCWVEMRVVLR